MPSVTPRFIPSCSDEMLGGLGRIAEEYGCHVQTHCSESDWQHNYVIERHGVRDAESLDNFGLLRDKAVLAHAILIDDADMRRIRQRQAGIAHCPLSNIYFSHAVFPARRALDSGLKVGLGTDISGGSSPGILQNCRQAVSMSRALEDGVNPALPEDERGTPDSRIHFREAFWMATVGGAKVLGLQVGSVRRGLCDGRAGHRIRDRRMATWWSSTRWIMATISCRRSSTTRRGETFATSWVQGREVRARD